MKIDNIIEAEVEAKRFLKRLTELKKSQANYFKEKKYTYTSKETSAVKRSSMDLTRALSKMRNDTY